MHPECTTMAKGLLRRFAKTAAAGMFHYTGLRKALAARRRRQSGGRRLLIVSYHRVVENFEAELARSIPGLLISKQTFRRHLEEALQAGYRFVSMDEAIEVLAGRKTTDRDMIVVTFDDGYRDVYRNAFPIMKELGVPAMIYLPSGYVGTNRRFNHDRLFHLLRLFNDRAWVPSLQGLTAPAAALLNAMTLGQKTLSAALDDFIGEHQTSVLEEVITSLENQTKPGTSLLPEQGDVMNWDEVREMAQAGIQFGAHTVNHSVLTLENVKDAESEIELARPIHHFAYCNGWYSDEVVEILAKHGFQSAVTTEDFLNRKGDSPFTLKRKVLWENFSIGTGGRYSSALTGCQLDDVFGMLGVHHPVPGLRTQWSGPIKNAPAKNVQEVS